jgi:hypothetical protein
MPGAAHRRRAEIIEADGEADICGALSLRRRTEQRETSSLLDFGLA